MAFINKQWNVDQLAELTADGFTAADFPQIRNAVGNKMREIYGNDIDISSASADGQYINMEALILNNIYRVLESLAKSMNPYEASGKYLDILASYTGAFRRQPTYSTVQLWVWNTSGSSWNGPSITCMDKQGNEWIWYNPLDFAGQRSVSIPPMTNSGDNAYKPYGPLTFTCKTYGSVYASGSTMGEANWQTIYNTAPAERGCDIYQTINAGQFQVYHTQDAIAGADKESDASLRARRNLSFGESGSTVINSLYANLLAVDGIEDVWIFNNNTGADCTMADNTEVPNHDVYIVIFINPNTIAGTSAFDRIIGQTIYDQLTPGVLTTESQDSSAQGLYEIKITDSISTNINWKNAPTVAPSLQFTLQAYNTTFSTDNDAHDAQSDAIVNSILTYLESITLGNSVRAADILSTGMAADFHDPQTGNSTYALYGLKYCSDASGQGIWADFAVKDLPLCRLKYSNSKYTVAPAGDNLYTFTIGLDSSNNPVEWPAPPAVQSNVEESRGISENDSETQSDNSER